MDTSVPKEIIVKLWDLNTLDDKFQKKFASVFVQQDRKYVGMLLFNQENSCKLLFNPYSKVKFTLKNMQTSQIYGESSIVLRMLKDLKGKQGQILALDGSTIDEIKPNSGFKPNIELEYQWNPAPIDKGKLFDLGDIDSGLKEAWNTLRELVDQLLELLNEQLETDQDVNQQLLQYLETKIANQIAKITDEKEATVDHLHGARKTLADTERAFTDFEQRDMKSVGEINNSVSQVDNLIQTLEANSEEAKKKNLEIRKKTGTVTSLTAEDKEIRLSDEKIRHKKKTHIDNVLSRIFQLELGHLKTLDQLSMNEGLHEAEEATKIYDDVIEIDGELPNPHLNDKEKLDAQELLNDKQMETKLLENEIDILDKNLDNLDSEMDINLNNLSDLRAERYDKIQDNVRLEKLIKELEEEEEKAVRLIESLRDKATPIKDISLETSRRITDKSRSKSNANTKTMSIRINENNIEFEPDKLGSKLIENKHLRDRARSDLGEGESKWKSRVNNLYEGVDDLYTPSTKEMDQRAEIHRLLDELKECRTRTEILLSLLDEIQREKHDIESENMRIMRQELAKRLTSDEIHMNKVRAAIASTKLENKEKDTMIQEHKVKIKNLEIKFQKLLEKRKYLYTLLETLKRKVAQRESEEAQGKKAYEDSLKLSTKQIEINEEIKNLKRQIADVSKAIALLNEDIEDLREELIIIQEKITMKITINRKRMEADRQQEYIPDRNDPADVKIAQYLNVEGTTVPIKKLATNEYMFGRKKIFLTQNASSAGGYSVNIPAENKTIPITTLLTTYAEEEIKHLSALREDQEMVIGEGDHTIRAAASPNAGREIPTFG